MGDKNFLNIKIPYFKDEYEIPFGDYHIRILCDDNGNNVLSVLLKKLQSGEYIIMNPNLRIENWMYIHIPHIEGFRFEGTLNLNVLKIWYPLPDIINVSKLINIYDYINNDINNDVSIVLRKSDIQFQVYSIHALLNENGNCGITNCRHSSDKGGIDYEKVIIRTRIAMCTLKNSSEDSIIRGHKISILGHGPIKYFSSDDHVEDDMDKNYSNIILSLFRNFISSLHTSYPTTSYLCHGINTEILDQLYTKSSLYSYLSFSFDLPVKNSYLIEDARIAIIGSFIKCLETMKVVKLTDMCSKLLLNSINWKKNKVECLQDLPLEIKTSMISKIDVIDELLYNYKRENIMKMVEDKFRKGYNL